MDQVHRTGALWNHDFRALWLAQAVSGLGSTASGFALPLLVITDGRSATAAGVLMAVIVVATMAARLPAGFVADRYDRRVLMVGSDVARAAIMGAFALVVVAGDGDLVLFAVMMAVISALSSLFTGAAAAALRRAVPDEDLPTAGAFMQGRLAVVTLAGPPLGGLLFALWPAAPFLLDAVACLASAVFVSRLRTPQRIAPRRRPRLRPGEVVAGLVFLVREPFLRPAVIIAATLNLAFSGVYVAVVTATAAAGVSSVMIGIVVAVPGLGALAGAVVAAHVQKRMPPGRVLLGVSWLSGILIALLATTLNPVLIAVLLALSSALAPVAVVVAGSAQALRTPDHLQGRAQNAWALVAGSVAPLGLFAAGALADAGGHALPFLVLGGTVAALALVLTGSRALRGAGPLVTMKPEVSR
ncbi:MFS transporter [Nonomuraea sp. NPDC050540]|uniref:MFS transporter n=1 Tax=Nonomuraea sp. NPDC050540 TaxID=3364367 RepID=UPI00378EF494